MARLGFLGFCCVIFLSAGGGSRRLAWLLCVTISKETNRDSSDGGAREAWMISQEECAAAARLVTIMVAARIAK
ncbi:hypothetical protein VIGAN_08035600 [Vigna angularis var. angularis]|uniref:Secreted protein n=1 Tax=Vigna angularis var. angularis TaxID=157739 RepID=A0A0S3SLW7_PHAAN|nr:hypothetical protein VIGAN_08035600 [Vigna angularis var. angularis]